MSRENVIARIRAYFDEGRRGKRAQAGQLQPIPVYAAVGPSARQLRRECADFRDTFDRGAAHQ